MVTEVAIFTALPGKESALGQGMIQGLETIRQHPECISANATHCIEKKGRYMLTVNWTSLDAHLEDFRNSPLFVQWRSHINGLTENNTEVFHYEAY